MTRATFYFDLGSPFAYLAAERLAQTLGTQPAWQPVSLGAIFKATGRSSWALGEPESRRAGMAEVERRARLYGLPAVRWPDPWPTNYLFAMRVATFAARLGRARELALSAFRVAFQEGRDLAVAEHVLLAAEAAGLDRAQAQAAADDAEVKVALRQATDAAQQLGVFGVPTVAAAGELFWGDDRLEDAAAALRARAGG
jgi:2-hydroxychromene-2-carboxylate isomerase